MILVFHTHSALEHRAYKHHTTWKWVITLTYVYTDCIMQKYRLCSYRVMVLSMSTHWQKGWVLQCHIIVLLPHLSNASHATQLSQVELSCHMKECQRKGLLWLSHSKDQFFLNKAVGGRSNNLLLNLRSQNQCQWGSCLERFASSSPPQWQSAFITACTSCAAFCCCFCCWLWFSCGGDGDVMIILAYIYP